jgi:hypothetical protein
VEYGRENRRTGRTFEEAAADELLPQHDAGRIQIDAMIEHLTCDLLGRHVRELALHLTAARRGEAGRGTRDAEVREPREPVPAHDDVVR